MKKKIIVKHEHRYTKERAELYNGEAEHLVYDDHEELIYLEADGTRVRVCMFKEYMNIVRQGEVISNLEFDRNNKTMNLMKSPYGDFEIEIFTYEYMHQQGKCVVEYDVLSSNEEKDGYRIEFMMKEDYNELN